MDLSEPMLDSAEVSRLLAVAPATLDDWARNNTGPAYVKVGRLRRYPRSDLEAWLTERRVAAS